MKDLLDANGNVEIKIGGETLKLEQCRSSVRFLDHTQLATLLGQRLGKTESQIHQLLESYNASTSS